MVAAPIAETGPSSGRDRILDAAAARFAELGFTETSLRLIAGDVEMKAGSLYYHFGSKDELFVSVLARGIALMSDGFDGAAQRVAAAAEQQDARAHLAEHVRAHLRVLHGNFAFTSLHVTSFRTAPEAVRAAIVPERDAYEAKWTALLGSLLPGRSADEIGILRLVLFGAINSSIEWFDARRGNLDDFADVVTDQFWNGASRPHEKDDNDST
ncbi:MAG: TetR/AcrR family transcriptional regulator [Ilumatobacter sp.]|nr:TetR/AcrR family transcriptional regulator [Ilumatobacter sp.]